MINCGKLGNVAESMLSTATYIIILPIYTTINIPYSHSVTLHRANQGQPARRARHADAAAAGGGVVSFLTAVSWVQK